MFSHAGIFLGRLLKSKYTYPNWATQLHAAGSPNEAELKKNGFTSKTSRSQYFSASRIWSSGQVAAIVALLSKTDIDIRSSGTAFQDTLLSLMIYEIIIKNGAYCSEYE